MLYILFLENSCRLFYNDQLESGDAITILGTKYLMDEESKEYEGFIGFFDWLRKDEKTIVGVRCAFFAHHSYNAKLRQYPYTQSPEVEDSIEILFDNNQTYDKDLSGDQDFTNNFVYKSDSGDYVFSFGLDNLTAEERNSLKAISQTI